MRTDRSVLIRANPWPRGSGTPPWQELLYTVNLGAVSSNNYEICFFDNLFSSLGKMPHCHQWFRSTEPEFELPPPFDPDPALQPIRKAEMKTSNTNARNFLILKLSRFSNSGLNT